MSPYGQFDEEIKRLIRQGCNQNDALNQLATKYPQLVSQAADVLKYIQKIERELRSSGG